MKFAILLLCLLPFTLLSQLTGELSTGRAIQTDIDYKMEGNKAGKLVFEIAVDMEGKVTSCKFRKDLSTIVSTPLMMEAKNRIITGLSFERGYQFPEFQYGFVTITVTLPASP